MPGKKFADDICFFCAYLRYKHVNIYTVQTLRLGRRGAVREKFVSQHLSGAGSCPAGSVGWNLNVQKLHYEYLTTSVAVVLVVR